MNARKLNHMECDTYSYAENFCITPTGYSKGISLLDQWPAMFIHSEVWSLDASVVVHMHSLFINLSCGVHYSNLCFVSHSFTWHTNCLQASGA